MVNGQEVGIELTIGAKYHLPKNPKDLLIEDRQGNLRPKTGKENYELRTSNGKRR